MNICPKCKTRERTENRPYCPECWTEYYKARREAKNDVKTESAPTLQVKPIVKPIAVDPTIDQKSIVIPSESWQERTKRVLGVPFTKEQRDHLLSLPEPFKLLPYIVDPELRKALIAREELQEKQSQVTLV